MTTDTGRLPAVNEMSGSRAPKVFISYSHDSPEHQDRVIDLANRLRADGIDARCDQYETSPAEGWQRWMERQLRDADFVLMVCSDVYRRRVAGEEEAGKGLGVAWEGNLILQHLYEAGAVNKKFIPVLLANCCRKDIPMAAKATSYFNLETARGYEDLYRLLTDQPRALIPELGKLRRLPSRDRRWVEHPRESAAKTEQRSYNPEPKKPIPESIDRAETPRPPDPRSRTRATEANQARDRTPIWSWRPGGIIGAGLLVAASVGIAAVVLSGGNTTKPLISDGAGQDQSMQVRIYAGEFSGQEYSVFKNGQQVGATNKVINMPYVPLTLGKNDTVVCKKTGRSDLVPQPVRVGDRDYYCEKP